MFNIIARATRAIQRNGGEKAKSFYDDECEMHLDVAQYRSCDELTYCLIRLQKLLEHILRQWEFLKNVGGRLPLDIEKSIISLHYRCKY